MLQKKTIKIHEKNIDYTLKTNRRSKRIRLVVHHDGKFVVTTPSFVNQKLIDEFIIQKSEWILDKINYFKSSKRIFVRKSTKADYKKYKETARQIAEQKIERFNKMYGFKFKSISIKNQKTRWGSCSIKGNLNFNYKIALIPEKMADYIIIHELCHLEQFNHSKKFWNLVAKAMPDYSDIRKQFKNNIII